MELPRTDAMDSVVFDQHNLDLFLNGTTALYKIFLSVIEDKGLDRPYAQKDILDKISESLLKYWHPLEAVFVKDPFTGYEKGKFTSEENVYPSKVFIDICDGVKTYMEQIKENMDKSYQNETDFRETIRALREELTANKQELRDIHTIHRSCKLEMASLKATVQHLEGINLNKTDQIVELQRADTVQLWEKEKARLLQNNAQRMKDLEQQVESLTIDKASLQQKQQNFEIKLGAEKLKNEIHQNQLANQQNSPVGDNIQSVSAADPVNVQQLRQYVYVLEKDLKKIDSELHAQQKYVVGILSGLQTDYNTAFCRMIDNPGNISDLEPNTALRIKGIQKIINRCLVLAKGGKLSQACADLPDYYVALDRDINKTSVRKISVGYNPKGLAPIERKNSTSGVKTSGVGSDTKPLPTITKDNPQMVNPKTSFVNHITVLKHFPHFTRDYVQQQYKHFKEFDTNGDNTLDITEVMSAMTKTLGQQFTARQIKEAMLEVDVDGDHTLDFFEYLKVSDMLAHKNGQSDVFRSDLVKQQGRNMSKTCIVM